MRNGAVQNLLIRAPNWLGDAVMCEPAIRGLKRLFPQASLSLLAKPAAGELFQAHGAVDRVIVYEDLGRHGGLLGKWTLAGELRRAQFDMAVLFQNAFEAALLTCLAGISRRYGYATDGRSVFLTEPVAVPDRRTVVHQVHYYWNLLRPLGLTGEPLQPELALLPVEEESMAGRLKESGITDRDTVIGVNPGSTYGGAKRWLPERFADTVERLSGAMDRSRGQRVSAVILGAKGEEALGRDIAARLSIPSAVLSGATGIRELMAAIKRCALLLTNDTGPMHIASAFHVPIVAVFGPTDWRTTSPYGAGHTIVRHPVECSPCLLRECPIDHRCMTGVSVDQVYEAAIKMRGLSGLSGPSSQSRHQTDQIDQIDQTDRKDILEGYTVFLDRDGTLNEDPGYLKSAAELKLLPGVAAALARLKAAGARLVVVTNQSGIGRGFFTLKDLETVHARLQGLLEQEDAALDAVYFCPHHPDDGCRCRKPSRGMVDRAVSELQIDLNRSYLIGDHARDMQLAKTVGAKAVLLTQSPVDEQSLDALQAQDAMPDTIAKSMAEAVDWILKDRLKAER
ncbi:MAG TPA: D-glycero-beta-D-manno-heptose 1,7-bisphosphate 7-phosphatase [Nitrospira sp.]|nr:D-glycero-beta-D-manno-heptose 1,7-bisphosphate 7-phosphatase [Nitrospira sp.]